MLGNSGLVHLAYVPHWGTPSADASSPTQIDGLKSGHSVGHWLGSCGPASANVLFQESLGPRLLKSLGTIPVDPPGKKRGSVGDNTLTGRPCSDRLPRDENPRVTVKRETPVISIVIPAHNSERFLQRAINSVRAQTYPEHEIIVIDDGSTDRTVEILSEFNDDDAVYWETGPNCGAAAARNKGLTHCRGRFVKFLDADDELVPGTLRKEYAAARRLDPLKQIACGYAIEIDIDGNEVGVRKSRACPPGDNIIAHTMRNSPVTSCPLHPMDAVRSIGGFDETLPRGQETNLHFRLALEGYEFVSHNDPVYYYRQHTATSDNITSGGFTKFGPEYPLTYVDRFRRLAEEKFGGRLHNEVVRALALMYWEAGRGVLREGYGDVARICFQRSRQLDPSAVSGSRVYQAVNRVVGPFRAEAVVGSLKRAASPRKREARTGE